MPLHDHFHSPLDDHFSWEGFHAQWPAMVVQALRPRLPRRFTAEPGIHLGAFFEVDVATLDSTDSLSFAAPTAGGNGGNGGPLATAVYSPPRPTLVLPTDLPEQSDYEVRIYDQKRGRRLVAAVEFVSPSNKDRPEHRLTFAAKCAALLQKLVSVVIVDIVTTRRANLYHDTLELLGLNVPTLGSEPSPIYAVACRVTGQEASWQLESWAHPLSVGGPLPTLPLWLADNFAVPLELEVSYSDTCRAIGIT